MSKEAVKGPLRLDAENCGGGVNLHAIVAGEDVAIAWTTRCVVDGVEVVTDAQAKATAQALAHRYNVHENLVSVLKLAVARLARKDHGCDSIAASNALDALCIATGEAFDVEAFIAREDAEAAEFDAILEAR